MPERFEKFRSAFYLIQIGLGVGFVGLLLFFRSRGPESGFRVRESERYHPEGPKFPSAQPLPAAGAKPTGGSRKSPPLSLPGIRIDGAAHEILGIAPNASQAEIRKAHRELIKRYHPDVIGRPGSREWRDAQRIAEAVNRAKDEMLQEIRARGGRA